MKRILCYGDLNTWGWNPITQERYNDQNSLDTLAGERPRRGI